MMHISSRHISKLLSGKNTKGHKELIDIFINNIHEYYNPEFSPIDALRTGAILEGRFYLTLSDMYLPQYEVWSKEYDFCKATLDFAYIRQNKVERFKELKTCFFTDFLTFQAYKNADYDTYIDYIKKNYKQYYNQVQYQLFCSGLDVSYLVFLEVKSYNDADNYNRIIQPDEYIEFPIKRDESTISQIKQRLVFFKQIKDYFIS